MTIPFISVRHPRAHDIVDDPVEVAGVGTGFEGTLSAPAQCRRAGDRREVIPGRRQRHLGQLLVPHRRPGRAGSGARNARGFEVSAEDGSELHKRVVPILFGRALVDPFHGFAVHTVRTGDTLGAIADEFYGDSAKFRIIFAANRHVLDDPDVIVPGQVLRSPQ